MNLILADTFYFLALLSVDDQAHNIAESFPLHNYLQVITTRCILIEVADAFAHPKSRSAAAAFIRDLSTNPQFIIVANEADLFDRGLKLYESRKDKSWPLTDCISFVVMREIGIKDALTADRHFEQAGFRALLK